MTEPTRRRPPIARIVVLLVLVVAGVFGYQRWRIEKDKPKPPPTYAGNVDIRDVTLSFRAAGRVEVALKREGDVVHKGDVIAHLDAAPYRVALGQAQAATAVARAQLNRVKAGSRIEDIRELSAVLSQRKAAYDQAADTFARVQHLADAGAVTQQALTDATAALDESKASVKAAEASLARATNGARAEDVAVAVAQLAQAESGVAAAELTVADCELKSAVDGVVVTRSIEPGQMLGVGAAAFVIAIADPVWIRGFAPEADLARLVPGSAIDVFTDARPGKPYHGQIGYVATQAEFTPKNVETAELRTSLVYRFRVIVTEHDGGLRQGMPVSMQLVDGPPPTAASASSNGSSGSSGGS